MLQWVSLGCFRCLVGRVVCSLVMGASSVKFMSRLVVFSFVSLLVLSSCGGRYAFEMSRNYTPVYNPGGELFGEDEGFAQSYEIYEKRRNDVLQDQADTRRSRALGADRSQNRGVRKISAAEKEEIEEQLRKYGALPSKAAGRDRGRMVNKEGVDLSQIKGARFIDILVEDDGNLAEGRERGRSAECACDDRYSSSTDSVGRKEDCGQERKKDHVHLECVCGSPCDCAHRNKNGEDVGCVHDIVTESAEKEHGVDQDGVRVDDVVTHSEGVLGGEIPDMVNGDQVSDLSGLTEGQDGSHGDLDNGNGEHQREICSCDDEWCSSCYDASRYGTGIEEEYDTSDDDLTKRGDENGSGVFVPGTEGGVGSPRNSESVLPGKDVVEEEASLGENCSNKEGGNEEACGGESSNVSQTQKTKDDCAESPKQVSDDSYPLGFENGELVVSSGDDKEDGDFAAFQEDRLAVEDSNSGSGSNNDNREVSSEDDKVVDPVRDEDDIYEEDDWYDDEEEDFEDYEDEGAVQRKEDVVPQVGVTEIPANKESASPTMSSSVPTVDAKEKAAVPGYSGLPGYDEDDDDDDRYNLPIGGRRTKFYDFGNSVDDTYFP